MFLSKFRLVAASLRQLTCVSAPPPHSSINFISTSLNTRYPEVQGEGVSEGESESQRDVENENSGSVDGEKMSPIVDIDMDAMMLEDPSLAGQLRVPSEQEQDTGGSTNSSVGDVGNITTVDSSAVPLAPVDIDGWADEEEVKQGTVEEDNVIEKPIEYPPIPQTRLGSYEFQGIKVFLPQRLLTPQTYRYRLDADDLKSPSDDMRICRFDK